MNLFTLNGAQLAPGADFTTTAMRVDTAEEAEATGVAIGGVASIEVQHRYADLLGWSADQLARWGVTLTVQPDPPAPVVRPDLPKSTVTERLIGLGKVGAVMTVLRSDDGLYALWFAPDWQTVYKDDERVLPILQAAGLTADEIATVMA